MAFTLSYEGGKQFTPDWANINFSDFQSPDMNLIAQNARGAQLVADKRTEELVKKRDDLLDSIKLNKRFSDLDNQLRDNINGILENAGNIQLSDNANYTRLSTDISRAKNDPVIKNAIYTTEQAKKYQELRESKPDLVNQPWNNPNEKSFKDFTDGFTNEFDFQPVYEEYDYDSEVDKYVSEMKSDEIDMIKTYGTAGIYNLKKKGHDVDGILKKLDDLKTHLTKGNPKSADYFKRRNPYNSSEELLNSSFNKAANKYASTTSTISNIQTDPNVQQANERARIAQGWAQLQVSQNADKREQITFDAMNMDPVTFANTKGYEKYNQANVIKSASNSKNTSNTGFTYDNMTGSANLNGTKYNLNNEDGSKNLGTNFTVELYRQGKNALKKGFPLAKGKETSKMGRNAEGKFIYQVFSDENELLRETEVRLDVIENTFNGSQSGNTVNNNSGQVDTSNPLLKP